MTAGTKGISNNFDVSDRALDGYNGWVLAGTYTVVTGASWANFASIKSNVVNMDGYKAASASCTKSNYYNLPLLNPESNHLQVSFRFKKTITGSFSGWAVSFFVVASSGGSTILDIAANITSATIYMPLNDSYPFAMANNTWYNIELSVNKSQTCLRVWTDAETRPTNPTKTSSGTYYSTGFLRTGFSMGGNVPDYGNTNMSIDNLSIVTI